MIESEKGESCLLNMASSKAAHSLLGTKGLGSNSSQFEQGDTLSTSNFTVKMNPPDTVKVCKKITDKCLQSTSPTKIAVVPNITIKKVLTEPLNGKPLAVLVKSPKEVHSSETKDSTANLECTAIVDSGNKVEQTKDQDSDSSSSDTTVPNSVQNNCKQQESKNDEKHKWPSEHNVSPHQNSVFKTLPKLVKNTKNSKLKLPSPSSLSSKEDLDDVSIDLTEEEEDALLGKQEASDVEPDIEAHIHVSADSLEVEADDDKLDTAEWKVLDETEASTCSSEHSPRVSVEGMSPKNVTISPCRSTPRQLKPERENEKKEQTEFTSLCNNINSTITKLGILRLPQSVVSSDNLKRTESVKKNCETNSSQPSQDSSSKINSQTEKKSVSIKENLFDKYAKEKLVTTKISDIAFVPEDDDSDEEKDLKFKSSFSFFDNTATEDGMQLAVDKVVQKILTEISDDSDTNEVPNSGSIKLPNNPACKISKQPKEGSHKPRPSAASTNDQIPETTEVSQVKSNEMSDTNCAEALKSDDLVNPKLGGAEVPKPGGVEVPKAEGAEVPEAGVAEVPKVDVADTLMAEDAEVPKAEGAELPKAEGAEVPMDDDAAVPKDDDAAIPKAEGAEIPNVEDAEIPNAESAEIPKAEGLCVPNANGSKALVAEGAEATKAESGEASKVKAAEAPKAETHEVPSVDGDKAPKVDAAEDESYMVEETDFSKAEDSEVVKPVDAVRSKVEVSGICKAEVCGISKVEEAKLPETESAEELKVSNSEHLDMEKSSVKKPESTEDAECGRADTVNPAIINESGPAKRPIASPEKNGICEKKFKTDEVVNQATTDSLKKEDESKLSLSSVPEIKSAAQIAKEKTEYELKRKWITDGDEKPMDILTVKKVKLDSDSVREEVKLALNQQKVEAKPESIATDALKNAKCKGPNKMTKHELDDYIAKRINLFVTQDEKSDIGVLKLKCEYLEKSVDKWKKKASTMQKQITDMHIALQRAIQVRKTAVPAKIQVPTRSVGLQVQLNSLHPLPDQQLPRHITGPPAGSTVKRIPITSAGQGIGMNKTTAGNMTIINSVKASTATPTLQSMIAKPPLVSTTIAARPLFGHSTTTVTGVQIPSMTTNVARPISSGLTSIAPRPSPTYTNAKPTTTCVSILQPRIANAQPMTVVTTIQAPTVPTSSFPKVASVIPPSSTTVRAMLDSRRLQVDDDDDVSQENMNPSPKDENSHMSGDEDEPITDAENVLPCIDTRSKVSALPVDNDCSKKEEPFVADTSKNCLVYSRDLPVGKDVQQNSHTQNMTKAALRILRRFLSKYSETREINEVPPSDLDKYLACFFSTAKKKDGADYGPHTLTCIFDSIDRYLRVCRYPASIKKDEVFYMTRENLRAKRKHLRKVIAAKKRLAQALEQPSKFNTDRRSASQASCPVKDRTIDYSLPSPSKILSSSLNNDSKVLDEERLRRQQHSDEQSLQSILSKLSKSDSGIQIIKVEGGKGNPDLPCIKNASDNTEASQVGCNTTNWCSEVEIESATHESSASESFRHISHQNNSQDSKLNFLGRISSAWNYTMADCVVNFFRWLSDSALGEHRTLSDIPPLELDCHIVTYMTLNDSGKCPERLNELRTFWDNLSLHLALCNYSASIKADPRFPKSQAFMASLKKMAISSQMLSLARDKLSTQKYQDFEANLQVDMESAIQIGDPFSTDGTRIFDVKVLITWLKTFSNFDNQRIYLLDPTKLDRYLAQFFTAFKKDDRKFTAVEFNRLRDNIDGYLQSHNYPYSIKMGYDFRRSIECFKHRYNRLLEQTDILLADNGSLAEKHDLRNAEVKQRSYITNSSGFQMEQSQTLTDEDDTFLTLNEKSGFLEKRAEHHTNTHPEPNVKDVMLKTVPKTDKCDSDMFESDHQEQFYCSNQTEDYANTLSCNSTYPDEEGDASDEDVLTALLEPDISLIEDDDEIVINSSDDCVLDSGSFVAHQSVDSVSLFSNFLSAPWIKEKRGLLSLPPPDLDRYLALFFVSVKRKDQQDYDVEGLLSMQKNMNDFLQQNKYGGSILEDAAFEHCRMCLVAKCESLQHQKPEKLLGININRKLSIEEVDLLCKYNVIGHNCPVSILTTLVAYFMNRFGLMSTSDVADMTWGDIDIVSSNVSEMLVSRKHCSLQEFLQASSSLMLDSYAVKAYRKYKDVRSAEHLTESCRFFVFASSNSGPRVWFSDKPLQEKHIQRLQEYLQRVLVSLKLRRSEAERMLMYGELMAEFTIDNYTVPGDSDSKSLTNDSSTLPRSLGNSRLENSSMPVLRATLNQKPMLKNDANQESKLQAGKNESQSHSLLISRLAARVANEHGSRHSDVPNSDNRDIMYASRTRDDKLKEIFAAEGHAPNTIIKTLHDVNVFKEWLVSNQEFRDMYVLPATQLAQYLLQFFTNLKKRDGTDYEPNSLYSIYFSIDRYLKVNKYPGNIKTDATFQDCRKLFQERRREFDAERLRDALHMRRQVDFTFSEDDIQLLRVQQLLGPWNPEAMLLALWHANTVLLGIHSQKAHLHMLWGDIELLKSPEGHEYLEYHQHATKAKLATCPINSVLALIPIAKRPSKVFALPNKPAECPVELYKQFRLRRPLYTLTADSRFYLCPNQDPQSGVWFRSIPMGRSRLASIPATIWNLIRKVKGVGYGQEPAAGPSMGMLQLRAHLEMKPQMDLFHGMNMPPMNVLLPPNSSANTASFPISSPASKDSPSISLIPLFTSRANVMPNNEDGHSSNIDAPPSVGPPKNLLNLPSCFSSTTMNPSGPPVPMRLVPNQAAVKQAGPPVRPPAPACQPGQAVASGPATPATVKIIDLTADEDEGNNLQTAQVQAIIPTVVSAAASSSATSLAQMATMATQRPVTIIPASQAASMAGGQLYLNTSPSTGTVTVSTASPMQVRMATPIRTQAPPTALMTQQGQRVTYLVPSNMVRPPQQLYVPQTGTQARPMQQVPQQMTQQNILKPPIQTILFQRGTTLYPVAQGPVQNSPTSQSVMRPTQPAILRTTQATAVTAAQIPQVQVSSPRPPAPTVQVVQKQAVQRFNTPNNAGSTQNSNDQLPGTPVLVSKVIHKHPAPLPPCAVDLDAAPGMKSPPPKPALKISRVNNGIVLSWNMSLTPKHTEIARYQLYAYQESNAPPSTNLWKKVGDVRALPLPMACTLTQFMEGHKYHFAVRAVDIHDRIGPFSDPGSIVLSSPNNPPSSAPAPIRL